MHGNHAVDSIAPTVISRASGSILALAFLPAAAAPLASGPAWAARLIAAYPGMVREVTASEVVMRDGTRFPVSDGVTGKTPEERQLHPDFEDMFAEPYPAGSTVVPRREEDPGRTRFAPFFDHVYGDCAKGQVAPKLRTIAWMPSRGGGMLRVTTVNGVADHLEAVVRDLETLPSAWTRYLVPSAGTYVCRGIAGTGQRSMHGYGIAIDIATLRSDYWRWTGGGTAAYRNRIPSEIVSIFERHGFIWGGRWNHFDTMHFEYRPELLPSGT
jgi:hypothetical protein